MPEEEKEEDIPTAAGESEWLAGEGVGESGRLVANPFVLAKLSHLVIMGGTGEGVKTPSPFIAPAVVTVVLDVESLVFVEGITMEQKGAGVRSGLPSPPQTFLARMWSYPSRDGRASTTAAATVAGDDGDDGDDVEEEDEEVGYRGDVAGANAGGALESSEEQGDGGGGDKAGEELDVSDDVDDDVDSREDEEFSCSCCCCCRLGGVILRIKESIATERMSIRFHATDEFGTAATEEGGGGEVEATVLWLVALAEGDADDAGSVPRPANLARSCGRASDMGESSKGCANK